MPPKLSGGRRWMTRRKLFIVSELRSPSPGADPKAASDHPPSDCVLTKELRHIRLVGELEDPTGSRASVESAAPADWSRTISRRLPTRSQRPKAFGWY